MPDPIHTERLDLIPAAPEHLAAELDGPAALAAALGLRVPDGWPPDLHGRENVELSLVAAQHVPPEDAGWLFHYFVLRRDVDGRPTAIGVGGFKGPPERGAVEIGYSVVGAYRRRGLATEAVGGFLTRGFGDTRVQLVTAETYPRLLPSMRVLERCGFRLLGPGSEPGVLRYGLNRTEWERRYFACAQEVRP